MKIITRSDAKARGLKSYFDGKKCPKGHSSYKLVSNYTCIECLHKKHFAKRRIKRIAAKDERAKIRNELNGGHRLPPTAKQAKNVGLKRYYTGAPCPRGHISERFVSGHTCCECVSEASRIRDVVPERARKAKHLRDKRAANPESCRKPDRDKRANDIQYRIRCLIRSRIKHALKGRSKHTSVLVYLGCSIEHARAHLEAKFIPGMSWTNHGIEGWHIDHVIPIVAFDLTDEGQRKIAFHYTNLQPLWAFDNLSKNKRLPSSKPQI